MHVINGHTNTEEGVGVWRRVTRRSSVTLHAIYLHFSLACMHNWIQPANPPRSIVKFKKEKEETAQWL